MENVITRHTDSLALQDKEGIDKIKYRALSYRSVIKYEIQTTMSTVKKINHYQRKPMESLQKQVESIRTEMLNMTSLEQRSGDMDSDITLILILLDKTMKYIR